MDRHRAVAAVGRGDQAQLVRVARRRKRLLLVAGRDAAPLGQDPDLEEVHRLGRRRVELAVHDAGAGAHPLHVAGADHRAGAHASRVPSAPSST